MTNETNGKGFVTSLVKGEFDKALNEFDPQVKTGLTSEKLSQIWTAVESQSGKFKDFKKATSDLEGDLETIVLTTVFEKSEIDIKIVYTKDDLITGFFFLPPKSTAPYIVPSYVRKGSFSEKEVTIGRGKWALPGTLSLPRGRAPFPAVILVHGSGPNDRDETIGPNKPFRDIAWGLSSRGIAVLRYEKRTRQYGASMSPKELAELTLKEETVDDAIAAVDLLINIHQINNNEIFVLGHSHGGMAIPAIAKGATKATGFIIMAGNSRPLEDLLIEQYTYIFNLDGSMSPEEKAALADINRQVALLKSGKVTLQTPGAELPLGMPPAYWLALNAYDPVSTARNMKRPVLVIQGGRDYQVTVKDVDGWRKAFKDNDRTTFKVYPPLNHLFMAGEGRCTPSEYSVAGSVNEEVINDIHLWIKNVHQ